MTVENLFVNVFPDYHLGYIRVVSINGEHRATERTCDGLSAEELANLMNRECLAYYLIGSYWTIVVEV